MKKYEEILKERNDTTFTDLVKSEVNERALTEVKSVEEALALATAYVPIVQKKILMSEVGLPLEKKEKWLKVVDESLHDIAIVPQRRTMTEKRLAVLQSNRHPTAGAKFHQSVLESSSHAGMLMSETLEYEKKKIKLEKKFYLYKKKLQELEDKDPSKDTFILEKNLELKRLDLTHDILNLKGSEQSLQNKREELMEWSILKEELYQEAMDKEEIWSPDNVDGDAGYQEIPLVLRHLQNYLILKTQPGDSGNDISSVLNIEGLALTGVQNGLKCNKLGFYFKDLGEEQIKIIWLHMYGKKVHITKIPGFIVTAFEDGTQLIHPTTLANFEAMAKEKVV